MINFKKSLAVVLLTSAAALTVSAPGAQAAPVPTKPCIGIGKIGIQSVLALVNIGIQDVPILTSQQQQQCTENVLGEEGPLSHILDEIPILSG